MESLNLLFGYRGYLGAKLDKEDGVLVLDKKSHGELVSRLSKDGEYGHLVITDRRCFEVVKVRLDCDSLIVERGVDGTKPSTFPCGALLSGDLVPSDIRYMICNESCVDCDCVPVAFAGSITPKLKQGEQWEGSVVFSGDTPMTLGVSGAPNWMKVVAGDNYLRLSGVPTSTQEVTLSVGATNCGGHLETVVIRIE